MAFVFVVIGLGADRVILSPLYSIFPVSLMFIFEYAEIVIPAFVASIGVVVVTPLFYWQMFSQSQLCILAAVSVLLDVLVYWMIAFYPSSASFSDVMVQWGAPEHAMVWEAFRVLMLVLNLFIATLLRWLMLDLCARVLLKLISVKNGFKTL